MVSELSVHCHLVLVLLGLGDREHCGGNMWLKKLMCLMEQEVQVATGKNWGLSISFKAVSPVT